MTGVSAIFTRRSGKKKRVMHAVAPGASTTVCGLPVGTGSGLVRDGDYWNNVACLRCWPESR